MDNSGLRESANGVGFVCPTRQALRLALSEAGVPQSEVQVFFLYKARPRRAYDRVAANAVWVPLLLRQVEESPARVLLALGNTVVQALVGGETTVRASRGVPLSFGGRPLDVSYHPLAVWRGGHPRGVPEAGGSRGGVNPRAARTRLPGRGARHGLPAQVTRPRPAVRSCGEA